MKRIGQFLLVAVFFTFIFLAQNAQAQTERTLSPFDEISVTGNINVKLSQGESEKLTIKAEGIPEDKISIKVNNGTLKLRLLNSIFYKNEQVNVVVSYKTLRGIKGTAGANIENTGTIETDKLETKVGSGALVELNIKTNAVEASATEGGVLRLAGSTDTQNISAATGGHVDGLDLDCNRTYVKANTGGHAEVVALESIEATANTGGRIEYKGNPSESSTKTLISGEVRKL